MIIFRLSRLRWLLNVLEWSFIAMQSLYCQPLMHCPISQQLSGSNHKLFQVSCLFRDHRDIDSVLTTDHNDDVRNVVQTIDHIQPEPKMSNQELEPSISSEAFYPTSMLSTPRKKLAGPAPAYSNQSPSTPIKKRTALPSAPKSNEEDFSTLSIQIPPKNRYTNAESNNFITSIRPAMQSFTLPGISTDLLRNNSDRKLFKPPTSYRSFKRTLEPGEEEEDQRPAKRIQVRSAARPSPFRPLEVFTSKDSEVLSTEDHLEEEVYKDDAHRMRQAMARYESPSSERKGGAMSKAKGSVFRFDDF